MAEPIVRSAQQLYPDYNEELTQLYEEGITADWVHNVIRKHQPRAEFDRSLYHRYRGNGAPIYTRSPRFHAEANPINNRLSNDFFGEIVDVKTGYFSGRAFSYSYAPGQDEHQPALVEKALGDFVVRSNMFDIDMQCTKMAACCGYAARMFYFDNDGMERCLSILPFEVAVVSALDVSEPAAAVRYFRKKVGNKEGYYAEVFDTTYRWRFFGEKLDKLSLLEAPQPHLFDICPLQIIANNSELVSDAEKQLPLIDAYDRALSDANNECESFASAYMVFENVDISDEQLQLAQHSGAIRFFNGPSSSGKIYFVTKNVNDEFLEHHLNRLQENIYRFSKTPNLQEEHFSGNSSGVALKFKLSGLETKCGMWQAKMSAASTYMFRLLCGVWQKRGICADPLQCTVEFHRNFPLDLMQDAQAVKTLVDAGVPRRSAFAQLPFADDLNYLLHDENEDILTKEE